MEIRITSGNAKNKKLKAPQIEGFRAVQEIAKLAVFSIIGEKIKDSVCLDLFAGSGNMGIEALSRGAKWCDFVDGNGESITLIKENLQNCGFLTSSEVFLKDAVKFAAKANKKYDFVFMDPFYKDLNQRHLLKQIKGILNADGRLIYFHDELLDISNELKEFGYEMLENRKFGQSVFTIAKI